jgi:hypothetical protein
MLVAGSVGLGEVVVLVAARRAGLPAALWPLFDAADCAARRLCHSGQGEDWAVVRTGPKHGSVNALPYFWPVHDELRLSNLSGMKTGDRPTKPTGMMSTIGLGVVFSLGGVFTTFMLMDSWGGASWVFGSASRSSWVASR